MFLKISQNFWWICKTNYRGKCFRVCKYCVVDVVVCVVGVVVGVVVCNVAEIFEKNFEIFSIFWDLSIWLVKILKKKIRKIFEVLGNFVKKILKRKKSQCCFWTWPWFYKLQNKKFKMSNLCIPFCRKSSKVIWGQNRSNSFRFFRRFFLSN